MCVWFTFSLLSCPLVTCFGSQKHSEQLPYTQLYSTHRIPEILELGLSPTQAETKGWGVAGQGANSQV